MDLNKALSELARNGIRLSVGQGEGDALGRFGGAPDVPVGFAWPRYETAVYDDDTVKPRPLSFMAQFDCAALAPLDTEGLLPHEGVLSFFYEMDSQPWGFDTKDAGCARAYWFPDKAALTAAEFPADLGEWFRFPALPIYGRRETEYPSYEEFPMTFLKSGPWTAEGRAVWDVFDEARTALRGGQEDEAPYHRLLGWPVVIQNAMPQQCELVRRGYYLGGDWRDIPEAVRRETEETAREDWLLLFQLDSGVTAEDFCLDFGDCGCIYYYIRREDLAARRFDRVWLIQQCC